MKSKMKEIIKNCRIDAHSDGQYPVLIQDVNYYHASIAIRLLKKGWKKDEKVIITVERVAKRVK